MPWQCSEVVCVALQCSTVCAVLLCGEGRPCHNTVWMTATCACASISVVTGVVIKRAQLRQHLLQQPGVEQHSRTVHTELRWRGWAALHTQSATKPTLGYTLNVWSRFFADLLSAADSPEEGNMRALTSIVDSISAADGAVAFPMDIPK